MSIDRPAKKNYTGLFIVFLIILVLFINKMGTSPEEEREELASKIMTHVANPGTQDSKDGNRIYYLKEDFELGRAALIKLDNNKDFSLEIQNAKFNLDDIRTEGSACTEPNMLGVSQCTIAQGPLANHTVIGRTSNGGTMHIKTQTFEQNMK